MLSLCLFIIRSTCVTQEIVHHAQFVSCKDSGQFFVEDSFVTRMKTQKRFVLNAALKYTHIYCAEIK